MVSEMKSMGGCALQCLCAGTSDVKHCAPDSASSACSATDRALEAGYSVEVPIWPVHNWLYLTIVSVSLLRLSSGWTVQYRQDTSEHCPQPSLWLYIEPKLNDVLNGKAHSQTDRWNLASLAGKSGYLTTPSPRAASSAGA